MCDNKYSHHNYHDYNVIHAEAHVSSLQHELSSDDIDGFQRNVHQFLFHFLALPNGGGSKLDVTLYIHWLTHHAAAGLRTHGPSAWYSCEALERHNSFARFFVRHKSNYADVAKQCFIHELMFDDTEVFKRKPRAWKRKADSGDHESEEDQA